ncbi:3',5'-cyclic-nucleotide phosphodiesterase pde1 [Blyttiomyces sp. JEL0837]|nr:3',5'-cyclic-nucleotide phosphodiesterase pde1 [Blyttiomyces sp. JEL0837]
MIGSQDDLPGGMKPVIATSGTLNGVIGPRKPSSASAGGAFNMILWPDMVGFGFYYGLETGDRVVVDFKSREGEMVEGLDGVQVLAVEVSHGVFSDGVAYNSTCFFVGRRLGNLDAKLESDGGVALLCGDMGPDTVELLPRNRNVWSQALNYLIPGPHRRLQSIVMECSYPSSRNDSQLYGHLTPRHLIAELKTLESLLNERILSLGGGVVDFPLEGLVVVVTHFKEIGKVDGNTKEEDPVFVDIETIKRELDSLNDLGVEFVFAVAGEVVEVL